MGKLSKPISENAEGRGVNLANSFCGGGMNIYFLYNDTMSLHLDQLLDFPRCAWKKSTVHPQIYMKFILYCGCR